jgi:hypothetical protein
MSLEQIVPLAQDLSSDDKLRLINILSSQMLGAAAQSQKRETAAFSDAPADRPARIPSPRLANPAEMADFKKIIE